jgi:hypothetical protein
MKRYVINSDTWRKRIISEENIDNLLENNKFKFCSYFQNIKELKQYIKDELKSKKYLITA